MDNPITDAELDEFLIRAKFCGFFSDGYVAQVSQDIPRLVAEVRRLRGICPSPRVKKTKEPLHKMRDKQLAARELDRKEGLPDFGTKERDELHLTAVSMFRVPGCGYAFVSKQLGIPLRSVKRLMWNGGKIRE